MKLMKRYELTEDQLNMLMHWNEVPADLDDYKEINGSTSDGYHTFDELYEHRNLLFLNFIVATHSMQREYETTNTPECIFPWWSKLHSDDTMFEGYIIVGTDCIPGQMVTYHVPDEYRELLIKNSIRELPKAPEWDGHTSKDVLDRLRLNLL